MIYALNAVSQSVDVQVVDDTGLPVTGLLAATFPAATYSLAGASVDVSISLVDLASISAPWTSGGLKERGGGVYRLDLPNAVFGTIGEIKIRGEASGKHLLAPWIDVGVTVGAVSANVSANVVEWAGVAAAVGADNLPKVGMWGVFGTLLTQAAGSLAASLSKFLDVAAPTFTAAAVDQTGDSYARIGATGSGLTSLAPAATALSNALWTSALAGYLDNLNVGGAVASHADILAINQSASRRIVLQSVAQFTPGETYTVELRTYDPDGAAVNADSTPSLTATGAASGNLSANLSAATNPTTGLYRWTYTPGGSPILEQIRFDVAATLATQVFAISCYAQVVDQPTATFTATDKSNLTAIFNKLPANGIADETLLLAAIGSPQQAGSVVTLPANPPAGFLVSASFATACDFTSEQKASLNAATPSVTVAAYAAGQDPWSIVKAAMPSGTPAAGTVESLLQLLAADQYTDETTDPTQWHAVYVVAGSGAPGTGHVLATKKLFDTSGAKVTANTQVIGQASQ